MFIATLVAKRSNMLSAILGAADDLGLMGLTCGPIRTIEENKAWDIPIKDDPQKAREWLEGYWDFEYFDVIVQREADRHRKLLVADMDSTMITVECIDELADYAGLKAEVSEVTERAMRGEIDFAGALRDRVALIAGMKESVIAECLAERVKLMGGAKELVTAFRAAGGTALLVSGGFTHFTAPVAAEIGFDRAIANRLVVKDGALTGEVETPIVDAQTKKSVLVEALAGRDPVVSVAIGDGANDIPMIEVAGLGIAYHAKPKTIAAADACVRFGDLNVVRYALGL